MAVGVVRRVDSQVGLSQVAVESLAQRVNDGGIALQAHAPSQPVVKNGGDKLALRVELGLFFDQRSERYDGVLRQPQSFGLGDDFRRVIAVERPHHQPQQVRFIHVPRHVIRIRKQIALQRRHGETEGCYEGSVGTQFEHALFAAHTPGFHQRRNVAQRRALGNGQGVVHDPAVVQDVEDLNRGHAGAQSIFPRLQTRRHAVGLGIQDKGQGMSDQAGAVELTGDLLQARAPAYLDDLFLAFDGGRLVNENPGAHQAQLRRVVGKRPSLHGHASHRVHNRRERHKPDGGPDDVRQVPRRKERT